MANDELSADEEKLIRGALTEPRVGFPSFTSYFMRAQDTGTWFTEAEDDYMHDALTRYASGQESMYSYLYEMWRQLRKPGELWADPPYHARYWLDRVRYTVEMSATMPMFHWDHGWMPLEWGNIMHFAAQPEHTILGGFGCSKTTHVGVSAFVYACAMPRFRFVCAGPLLSNAKPMFEELVNIVDGTRAEVFIARSGRGGLAIKTHPFPSITLKNRSQLIFLGADKDINKVRSESGDWYCIEQSESHSDLGAAMLEMGTRGRGKVRGRKRLGRMTFVANSGEAPELWERFELADTEPGTYWSYNLTSYDNPHLSDVDIRKLERACGGDTDNINQYMRGLKPTGRFIDFARKDVLACEDGSLDEQMSTFLADEQENHDAQYLVAQGIGPIHWSLPAKPNRDYAVYGDPGTKNPPSRGAGVVIVLDETGWPHSPAELVHFKWTVGHNRIGPWLQDFEAAIRKYNAQGRAYFDSTGDQKNLDETAFQDRGLIVSGINMSGVKYGMKLKLVRLLERRMIVWAKSLTPIRAQFAKYDETNEKKLAQDIVMTFFLAANELSKRLIIQKTPERPGAWKRVVRGPGGVRRQRHVQQRAWRRS